MWSLFGQLFVSTGRFDPELFAAVRRIQELREDADYDAREISAEQAQAIITDAETFVAGVANELGG